ncbi:MAG: hypothetical protein ACQER9_04450 [Nanobdellota archaeon]
MTVLDLIYKENLNNSIKKIEIYIYHIYEKVNIIVEVKNKYYDIKHKNKGFIDKDKKIFQKNHNGIPHPEKKDKSLFYFKKWTNNRLKRIKKILDLELKHLEKPTENIADYCNKIKDNVNDEKLIDLLNKLNIILNKQIEYINSIYPIKNWDLYTHGNLFPDYFMNMINDELSIIFGTHKVKNYNELIGLLVKKLSSQDVPIDTMLYKLLETNHNKTVSKNEDVIKVFHARPVYDHSILFPLDVKTKETGFYVDKDPYEARNIVTNIYNIRSCEIRVYEILMPFVLFKNAKEDINSDEWLRERGSLKYAFVFKPSDYSKLNYFFHKNRIIIKDITGKL